MKDEEKLGLAADVPQTATMHVDLSETSKLIDRFSKMADEKERKKERDHQTIVNGANAIMEEAKDVSIIKEYISEIIENQQYIIYNQKRVISEQKSCIDDLRAISDYHKKQLEELKRIIVIIKEGKVVDSEILIVLEALLSKKPEWKEIIADKGIDFVIEGLVSILPQLFVGLVGL